MLKVPALRPFCEILVELGPIIEMGAGRAGQRRIIPILGGRVTGEITGRVMNVGADWQTVFADGVAELDTRYALETDDGAVIEVVNYGFRHGPAEIIARLADGWSVPQDQYYMRTQARLECGDERYRWVNRTLFIGSGARNASSVEIRLYSIE